MTVWPIFVARSMYEEPPVCPLAVGDEIDWDVRLVDGEAEGWPAEVLVDATVRPSSQPGLFLVESVLDGVQLSLNWSGEKRILGGDEVRAGLEADWFDPLPGSSVAGTVRRLQIVSRLFETRLTGAGGREDLRPAGGWIVADVGQSPRSLGPSLGWSKQVVIESPGVARGREPNPDQSGRPRVLSESLRFDGPDPGDEPVPQVTGLLVHLEVVR